MAGRKKANPRAELYVQGVAWIADNDEPLETNPDQVMGQLTVVMLSHLFDRLPEHVASDVLNYREAADADSRS